MRRRKSLRPLAIFKMGNLIALRELALREIADDVDERLESWRQQLVARTVAARGGYLCHSWRGPQAERLIRRGFRIAHRLKADWYVAFSLERHHSLSLDDEQRLTALQTLTERLGERSLCRR